MSNKKKHIGICAACGEEKELTFEHVPPRNSGNSSKAIQPNAYAFVERDDTRGKQLQRGAGFYSLCEEHNNFFGTHYVEDFVNINKYLVDEIQSTYFSQQNTKLPYKLDVELDINGLKFSKAVVAMFVSLLNENFSYREAIDSDEELKYFEEFKNVTNLEDIESIDSIKGISSLEKINELKNNAKEHLEISGISSNFVQTIRDNRYLLDEDNNNFPFEKYHILVNMFLPKDTSPNMTSKLLMMELKNGKKIYYSEVRNFPLSFTLVDIEESTIDLNGLIGFDLTRLLLSENDNVNQRLEIPVFIGRYNGSGKDKIVPIPYK